MSRLNPHADLTGLTESQINCLYDFAEDMGKTDIERVNKRELTSEQLRVMQFVEKFYVLNSRWPVTKEVAVRLYATGDSERELLLAIQKASQQILRLRQRGLLIKHGKRHYGFQISLSPEGKRLTSSRT